MSETSALVSTHWLAKEMKNPEWKTKYRLVDGTWAGAKAKRNFIEEHKTCRIAGARYFSLDECRNLDAELPNTVPGPSYFADYVSSLGITNEHHVIIYDNSEKHGMYSAPRIWWLFNLFGHTKVSVVDGGLPRWKKDGYDTVSGKYSEAEKWEDPTEKFKSTSNPELIKDIAFMKSNLENGSPTQVIDARSIGRFRGVDPESSPDVLSGHIPDSFNVPFQSNINSETKTLLPPDEIRENFKRHMVDIDRPMVSLCGSSVSACVLALASYVANGKMIAVFDDAWHGWFKNTPAELQIREAK